VASITVYRCSRIYVCCREWWGGGGGRKSIWVGAKKKGIVSLDYGNWFSTEPVSEYTYCAVLISTIYIITIFFVS
jgi:hypothetical protein